MTIDNRFTSMVDALTAERYAMLSRAVELGKWPDGRILGQEERETSLQILIAYDFRHKSPEERIGYVPTADEEDDCEHEAPATSSVIVKSR